MLKKYLTMVIILFATVLTSCQNNQMNKTEKQYIEATIKIIEIFDSGNVD